MDSSSRNNAGPDPNSETLGPGREGSVKRARQMLEAGRRPQVAIPQLQGTPSGPPPRFQAKSSHMTHWPLPTDDGLPFNVADAQARRFLPRGPLPERPPRPDAPSPSVYSERGMSDVAPSPLHLNRPVASFSHPSLHAQPPVRPPFTGALPLSRPDSAANSMSGPPDDMFRQSTASSFVSIPSIPDFPFPVQPTPAEHNSAQISSQGRLAPPNATKFPTKRKSSASPIPEELADSPTIVNGSYAFSRAIPSSWGSAPAGSDILDAYLDIESDGSRTPTSPAPAKDGMILRQASLGKMGRPSLRTIQKPSSPPSVLQQEQSSTTEVVIPKITVESKGARHSLSSISTDSSELDPEKPPIVVDLHNQHPAYKDADDDMDALQKELGILPRAAPTMSDKRPGGRKPPRLDMRAVRAAEARGSLTSLPDLIRRATRLASNLEHGRTASRNDLLNGGSRFAGQGHQGRKSGSIKDLLASFPPPAGTPEVRASWPDFFRRAPMQQLRSHETGLEAGEESGQQPSRRCCGMPPWLFMLVCIILIAIILVAVLIPVFLVLVPRHKSSGSNSLSVCEQTTPCENGGVSVSSGDICSCVCANGFTGSRCTVAGDPSCVTTAVYQGSTSKNATMGSNLPRLFEQSSSNFSIPLESLTIMALFSQNNVSCTTENALVAFKSIASSSSNTRRDANFILDLHLQPQLQSTATVTATAPTLDTPTHTLAARGSMGTVNGIVFDDSFTSQPSTAAPTATATDTSTNYAIQTSPSPTVTATATATATATPTPVAVPGRALDFARVAVLYIFEKTATLKAAMQSEESIEAYLAKPHASKTGTYAVDLSAAGVQGNFTLNFDEFTITMPNGTVVGGK
ncbi:uncharacterized protein ACLA_034460 [Aspergillus clavatus NRRL 1]|uniref:EGF-like domain-containing protein n=1 Tax=Aspergillus clavatus (strain ATCC 1007 / CBS 513.65 / DSM 816 / NCTC 3887 / NRRL 1 / QM 1276 / 107) TaxID=344612 RepID=A1CJB9_ASPCL|nr:uncharacterized protein ACLA_034460 [Aspergillus clavatus NRRL 1]EAW09243.1 conserved hypothetical protein [Aspergillus clavatus NRRL 1]